MKKKKIIQTLAVTLFLAVGSGVVIPAVSASATQVNIASNNEVKNGTSITIEQFENASEVELLDENTISIDGKNYDFNYVASVLCKEIDSQKPLTRNPATVGVKKAAKWVVENWSKIYKKLPKSVQQYFKLDGFMKVMDQFLSVSDSIEDFFHSCFRAMGMPEWANWAITNVIMLLLPI